MNIGFDLDKVLVDYPPLIPNWMIDKLYKEKDNGVLLYRIPGRLEQKIRQLSHISFLRQGIKKNLSVLKELSKDKKNNLYLISSRFSFLKSQTEEVSKRHEFEKIFKALYFNFDDEQPHVFKDSIIKKIHIDRYIDDDLSLITYLAKNNPGKKFFWLNMRENKQLAENLFAVTKIDDILA